MKDNIVNFQDYKARKQIKQQVDELNQFHEHYTLHEPNPVLRKGYKNFMKFMRAIDEKHDNKD